MVRRRRLRCIRKGDFEILAEETLNTILRLERKRSDRSGRTFALMLVDVSGLPTSDVIEGTIRVLEETTRETDCIGWYKERSVIAVILTEVGCTTDQVAEDTIVRRISSGLEDRLGTQSAEGIRLSVHYYPIRNGGDRLVYGDVTQQTQSTQPKRSIDLFVACALLVVLSPLLIAVAFFVKLTSRGPAIFKQARIGQFGKPFVMLKFRTMENDSTSEIHETYVRDFMASKPLESEGFYKIKSDPRVTLLGKVLRKTSLDELPQLFNVLKGDMSLVGPRPPLPYELDRYSDWHKRRVFEARPGITGLWQLEGRSRTTFDEMVRIDIRYIESWSVGSDIKIMFRTPWAILKGGGAC